MAGYFETHWYKDLMDVYRLEDLPGSLTKQAWVKKYEKVKCKVYTTQQAALTIEATSGVIQENNKIAYPNKYELHEGDEIHVWQYGIGYGNDEYDNYIVGKPKKYLEPFGGVKPNLEHTQASITMKKRPNI